MAKPNKVITSSQMQKNKSSKIAGRNSRFKLTLATVSLAAFLLGMAVLLAIQIVPKMLLEQKLMECPGHREGNIHYHATVLIYYLGEQMTIPPGVGLEGDCIHPVHTHDETNLVHVDYPKKYPFTLGDFFNRWGYIFNKKQFANIRTFDGYTIRVEVNGKENKEYERYVLKDKDRIRIYIEKNKK